jgi:capsular exopolysaccharide synthesis family protein
MDLLRSPQAEGFVPARPARPTPLYANAAPELAVSEDVPAQYWRQLWRIKWLVLGGAIFGIATGIVVAAFQTPVYRAKAVIELSTLNQNYLDMKGLDPTGGQDSLETFLQTQIQLLYSSSLLGRTAQKVQDNTPAEVKIPQASGLRLSSELVPQRTIATKDAVRDIARTLVVKGSGMTRLVEIQTESPNPELAADFANTLASEYMDQNVENRWDSMKKTGEWLTKKVSELRGRLEAAEQSMNSYAKSAQLVYTSDKDNVAMEQLKRLEQELSGAHVDKVQKQARYEQMLTNAASAATVESIPDVMENAEVRENRARLADLRRQRAAMATTKTAEHPDVQRLDAQITELSRDVTGSRQNVIGRIKNEYEQAQRREKMLYDLDMKQRGVLGDQIQKETRYNILKRDVESNRLMYDSMLQKLKEIGIAGAMPVNNVRIVDPAKAPQSPALPSRTLNAALGLVFGALAGMVLGFMRVHTDRYLRAPGEAANLLAVPEIGAVPSLRSDPVKPANWLKRWTGTVDEESSRALTVRQNPNFDAVQGEKKRNGQVDLALVFRDRSVMAEAYRGALPAILFANEQGNVRTLVVTSANPREGKTSTISNLAIGLADLNKRVLLIDGDVRSPRLHEVFGLSNQFGLADLLEHSKHDAKLAPISSGVDRLSVLPVGTPTEMTKNLLHSPRMVELLKVFEGEFDIVLIDTAPALHMRDARLLGSLADAVVMIVRAGQTSREAATAVIDKFRQDGTPVLGVILNDWKPEAGDPVYGKEYMNGYRHYYGH